MKYIEKTELENENVEKLNSFMTSLKTEFFDFLESENLRPKIIGNKIFSGSLKRKKFEMSFKCFGEHLYLTVVCDVNRELSIPSEVIYLIDATEEDPNYNQILDGNGNICEGLVSAKKFEIFRYEVITSITTERNSMIKGFSVLLSENSKKVKNLEDLANYTVEYEIFEKIVNWMGR